jgi:hypothetical protein
MKSLIKNFPNIALRRELALNTYTPDDVNLDCCETLDNIPQTVIKFFDTSSELIYPAKSYFVSIVYASALHKHFGGQFIEYLSCFDLLPYDIFFKPYTESSKIYDEILKHIDIKNILTLPSTQKTYNYFLQEFGVDRHDINDKTNTCMSI